jgi:hypothetical protein
VYYDLILGCSLPRRKNFEEKRTFLKRKKFLEEKKIIAEIYIDLILRGSCLQCKYHRT